MDENFIPDLLCFIKCFHWKKSVYSFVMNINRFLTFTEYIKSLIMLAYIKIIYNFYMADN